MFYIYNRSGTGSFWRIWGHPKFAYKSNLTYPKLTYYSYFNPRGTLEPPSLFIRIKSKFLDFALCTRNLIKISLLTRNCHNLFPKKVLYPKYKNKYLPSVHSRGKVVVVVVVVVLVVGQTVGSISSKTLAYDCLWYIYIYISHTQLTFSSSLLSIGCH